MSNLLSLCWMLADMHILTALSQLSTNVGCTTIHQSELSGSFNSAFIVIQVNSEFQAFKHIESLGRGELMRATRPLEVTVAVYPTLVLTNALPYDMDIVVWQVKLASFLFINLLHMLLSHCWRSITSITVSLPCVTGQS